LFGVIIVQLASALIVSLIALFWQGGGISASLLSGGLLVGANSALLARSVVGSSRVTGDGSRGILFRSAAFRFLLLIAALVAAHLVGLRLPAVAAGMFTAYVGGYFYIVKHASRFVDESGV